MLMTVATAAVAETAAKVLAQGDQMDTQVSRGVPAATFHDLTVRRFLPVWNPVGGG